MSELKFLVLVVLLVAGAWLGLGVVRFLRAGWSTRRSMVQAWLVRLTWRRVSRLVGLNVLDPTPTLLSSLLTRQGQAPGAHARVPRIRVEADSYGVLVRARTLPRVGREEWVKAAPHLANAWGCVRVSVVQERPGRLLVRAVRRDPLTEQAELVPSGEPPASLERLEIGRDEYASPVLIRLSNVPGVCIAGLPSYGKTSLVNEIVSVTAPSPAVQFAVVDGKGGADYEDLRCRFFAFVGDELEQANALFKRLHELRRRRSALIRSALGVKNFWVVGPSSSWPLVMLLVDEAHTFLAEVKGDRRQLELVAENRRLVEDLVKKGRSVGICTILATQKSTGDAIPTAIRDVCPLALSFAQRTDEAAVAALGADIRQYPDANPVGLQDPAYVGVASMVVEGRPGFVRVRMPYVRDEDVARVCQQSRGLTRDPLRLLGELPGPPAGEGEPIAAARGVDQSVGASALEALAPSGAIL